MKKLLGVIFLMFSFLSFSEECYIGDNITLKISGISSKTEIEKAFEDYKVKDIEKTSDNEYIVEFTTFKTGENQIKIGDKLLKFNVSSTISEKDTNIYESLAKKENMYVKKDYPYIVIYSVIFGTLLLALFIALCVRDILRNPFYIFRRDMRGLKEENWREKISLALRRCIDLNYNSSFLSGEYKIVGVLTEEDIEFIKKLDYLKFSLDKSGNKSTYTTRAKEIIKKIKKGEK